MNCIVIIAIGVIAVFVIFSILFIIGLYWCHYPYGRKWRNGKRKNRRH